MDQAHRSALIWTFEAYPMLSNGHYGIPELSNGSKAK